MGKKGKPSAGKAAAKAAKKEKAEKQATRKLTKQAAKQKTNTSSSSTKQQPGKKGAAVEDDEEDLDALLARYREQWEQEHVVSEEKVGGPPSRRANATFTPCPLGNDLYLFGGEYFNGERVSFYQDMYRYIPEKNEWRTYASKTQPGPRSAHQVAATAAQGGMLWLFGGEFSGARQNAFHHYRDLWAFSIETKAWERIDTKLRPSARSGHRMTFWKHYLVLFGGFIDTGVKTQYLNDLWIFDTQNTFKWTEIKQNDLRRPPPRSGFSLLSCPEGIVLHGGYCKKYVKGQRTQGVALEDTWFLKMDEDLTKLDWVKRRKVGYAPNPVRSGCTMALWQSKSMGILFGGVTDTEADEETMESTFHKDLYGYQLPGTGRWISLNLKRKKKAGGGRRKKKQQQQQQQQQQRRDEDSDDDGDSDRDDEEQLAESTEKLQMQEKASIANDADEEDDDDPDDPLKTIPLERYNVMLAVQRNTLYVYGGIFEAGNREYTLDDFYTLDLSKLERFTCLKDCPIDALDWAESESDDDSDSGSDSDSESSESESEGEEGDEIPEGFEFDEADSDDEAARHARLSAAEREALRAKAQAFMGVAADSARTEQEVMSTPQPGEKLRAFYERTKPHWAAVAMEADPKLRGKEMRKRGFALADQQYQEYKPILDEIERIRAEAGLDENEAAVNKVGGIGAGSTGVDSRNRR
ncbi:protein containing repeated kelch motifs [Moesziomyces antarcticus T-34]|uniref:Protein containing repeated kelch motifs n=1 Tax=Pseudozyma antarctica (strain T-34) TaxID=1151754 RepID=M9M6S3_PSEA3|nr:protein containing repeated kelch motifs [Moesziomyces antarcticus T-34]